MICYGTSLCTIACNEAQTGARGLCFIQTLGVQSGSLRVISKRADFVFYMSWIGPCHRSTGFDLGSVGERVRFLKLMKQT